MSDNGSDMEEERPATQGSSGGRLTGVVLGLLLVVVGAVLLLAQLAGLDLRIDLGRVGWPLFVIVPGVALLLAGLLMGVEGGMGLSIAGGIVATVGLLLAYQAATNHYASWAYGWALVAPGSVGAAMVLWGMLHRRAGVVRSGLGALGTGVVIFLVGYGFFEGLLNIGGQRGIAPFADQVLPLALIGAGLLIIIGRLLLPARPDAPPDQA
jgi:hypothetical protein